MVALRYVGNRLPLVVDGPERNRWRIAVTGRPVLALTRAAQAPEASDKATVELTNGWLIYTSLNALLNQHLAMTMRFLITAWNTQN